MREVQQKKFPGHSWWTGSWVTPDHMMAYGERKRRPTMPVLPARAAQWSLQIPYLFIVKYDLPGKRESHVHVSKQYFLSWEGSCRQEEIIFTPASSAAGSYPDNSK